MGTETSHLLEAQGTDAIRVFWRPGCSSCARVKEFLTAQGIGYLSVDVAEDPDALDLLARLGVRSVPVVMKGEAYTFAQSLDDVSRFLNIDAIAAERLPPQQLMARWIHFIGAARALVSRVPFERWHYQPVPEQSLVGLSYHIFRIPLSFVSCIEDGVEDWVGVAMEPPPEGTAEESLVALADAVQARLLDWWEKLDDHSCSWPVRKYDGVHSGHVFLERQVWHTAHHTRQLASALNQLGVDVDGVIDPSRYEGLPMPSRIW